MLDGESQKKYFGMIRTVTLIVLILLASLVIKNLTIYSYKYNNALSENSFDLKKKTEYLTYQYVNYLKNISKFSIASFQDYINNNTVGDVFLLKENGKNGFKIEASSDKRLIDKDYEDKGYYIYLYAPYIDNLEKMKNVIRISDEELYTFYTEYKTILPESITLFENLFNIVFSEKK